MKHAKRIAAVILVLVLTCTLIGNALAGSLIDTLKNAAKTAWNGLKTAGNAVCDTAVYVFTDDDAETAYRSTVKAAEKTEEAAEETARTAKQIKQDAIDVRDGAVKIVAGAIELAENGSFTDVYNYLTGDGPVNEEARQALERMKEGYGQMDNGLILDAIKLIPVYGTVTAAGIDAAKTGIEYAAGYIDEEQLEEHLVGDLIGATVGGLTMGAGELVDTVGEKIIVKVVGVATEAAAEELAK